MRPRAAAALLCALCCALARGSDDIVVGCGGFVKSDVEINYSLIEVGAAAPPAAGPGCLPGVPSAAARASGHRWRWNCGSSSAWPSAA